jgi:hypothetical protein
MVVDSTFERAVELTIKAFEPKVCTSSGPSIFRIMRSAGFTTICVNACCCRLCRRVYHRTLNTIWTPERCSCHRGDHELADGETASSPVSPLRCWRIWRAHGAEFDDRR